MIDDQKLAALANWLIAGALPQTDYLETVSQIARRLSAAGAPVDLLGLYGATIHPQMLGRLTYWTPAAGARHNVMSHADMQGPLWLGTAAQACQSSGRIVRHRIGENPELDGHPSAKNLKRRGFTDYVVLPLALARSFDNLDSVLGVGTKRAGGFTDEEVMAFRRIQAPLARVVELELLHTSTAAILSAYVGRNAGAMVMNGRILRGDGESIPAVILFTDLKNFTEMSNRLPPTEVIDVLNRFFDAVEGPIRDNGGEVLKFMGDGVLAIFPTPDNLAAQEAAATGALSAVDDARKALEGSDVAFRASLHVGDIHYGNIGSATRLDFTAIGPAVNLAARMLGAATEKDAATVCSAEFAALAPDRAAAIGAFDFKGFDAPAEVYAIG
jgi:adenylate cyclase